MRARALRSSSSAFSGPAFAPVAGFQRRRAVAVAARAYLAEYPDPEFIEATKEAFPDKGIANVEEARVSNMSSA